MSFLTLQTFQRRRMWCSVVICAVLSTTNYARAIEQPSPTPEELVALVQATRAQYKSVDIDYEVARYKLERGKRDTEPLETAKIIYRSMANHSFSRAEEIKTVPDTGTPYTITVTNAFSPDISKRLEEQNQVKPQGEVERGDRRKSELDLNPMNAMWNPYGETIWEQTSNTNSTVSRDPATGLLTIHSKCWTSGTSMVVVVDPSKGYLPIRTEMRNGAGKAIMWTECSDLRQVEDGLWMPYVSSAELASQYISVYKTINVRVNAELPKTSLDIEFPQNTYVRDRIANLSYEVGRDRELEGSLSQDEFTAGAKPLKRVIPNDVIATHPVSDAELMAVGSQAKAAYHIQAKQSWWATGGTISVIVAAVLMLGGFVIRRHRGRCVRR